MFQAMIMAGGGGTRFWPRSRSLRPKQFLSFSGERTLLQDTFDRVETLVAPEQFWVLTAAAHRDQARVQLPSIPIEQVIGEPAGRDTAPCVALGAALIHRHDPAATMVVMPADHAIEPEREFQRAIRAALQIADEYPHALITFGIVPTYPAIGYGYIHRGKSAVQRSGVECFQVQTFREKPTIEVAEQFVASGEYYWNAGIFVWKVAAIRRELQHQQPELFDLIERIIADWDSPQREATFRELYPLAEKKSIDYAVMEKAHEVLVLQAPYQWDDVGSWLALERRNPQDAHGNTIQALHTGMATSNCVIVGDPDKLIATIGVSNLLIIQDGDAILVADRREEATVKKIVDGLKGTALEKFL